MSKQSPALILLVATIFLTASGAALARDCAGSVELVNRRAALIDREHRLEENRDLMLQRIAQLKAQVQNMQLQSDLLNSEITNVKKSIADTDSAIATAPY